MTVPPTIDFLGYQLPPLDAGEYTLTVSQTVSAVESGAIPAAVIPATTFEPPPLHLFVAGPRFVLDPSAVVGVFPPPGSLGDHSAVLPHVLLRPSTAPWQRATVAPSGVPDAAARDLVRRTPWLALVLFDADEAPTPLVVRVGDLTRGASGAAAPSFPGLPAEPGDHPDDPVAVIDVPKGTLSRLLPTAAEMPLLTHVRVRGDGPGAGVTTAVVLGNRLPPAGAGATVHLVSLEHRLTATGATADPALDYEFTDLPDDALVRLVSLHHWSFTCTEHGHGFQGLAENLDRSPSGLRLPTETGSAARATIDEAGATALTTADGPATDAAAGTAAIVRDPGFGPAWSFDGVASGAAPSDGPTLTGAFGDPTQFTISCWVKPRALRPPALRGIVAGTGPAGAGLPSLAMTTTGALRYGIADEAGIPEAGELGGFFAAADTWVHVAWVKSGGVSLFYRDGTPVARMSAPRRIRTGSGALRVGTDPVWDGLVADVRVYGRALGADEVAHLPSADRTHTPELAGAHLTRGLVPVEHRQRNGAAAVAWYRGPLLPGAGPVGPPDPETDVPRHADGYLEYDADVDMFDASRAAAWELGRLLMLTNRAQAAALYRWKRERRASAHRAAQRASAGHLWTAIPDDGPPPLPGAVGSFLSGLTMCRGIPANYLLPDPALLPPESLRLVTVDPGWTEALLAGALTIGTQSRVDEVRPDDVRAYLETPVTGAITGVLLRSELVTAWPDLVIDASGVPVTTKVEPAPAPLRLLHREDIRPGVRLCLFDGVAATLDLHLPPEQMHVGLEAVDAPGVGYRKPLRTRSGQGTSLEVSPVPFRPVALPGAGGGPRGGVVRIGDLVAAMEQTLGGVPLSVAEVALELIEGVAKARFVVGRGAAPAPPSGLVVS